MNHTTLLMEIPNAVGHLKYDMTGQVFTEIGELDDLVEQLASFHHCNACMSL